MTSGPVGDRVRQAGRLVGRGAALGGRGVGRAAKWLVMESTIDTGRGSERFGDWLADRLPGLRLERRPNPAREFKESYPPRGSWQQHPQFGAVYRWEQYAISFEADGTMAWTSGDGWSEGRWTATSGMIEFECGVWGGGGPIAADRLYLNVFRYVLPRDPVEGIFEEFVLQLH